MTLSRLTTTQPAGVVGIGLMGSSIIASLLIAGHEVIAIAPIDSELISGPKRINDQLAACVSTGLTNDTHACLDRLTVSNDYSKLADCALVMECVVEQPAIKKEVYQLIAAAVSPETIVASNTSAIPISELQQYISHPERFMGIHWAEPAHSTRFLEITCGTQTSVHLAESVYRLAHNWGKEPTLLRKDIRGFITNRLMYAMYREMFSIRKRLSIPMEVIDKVFKYDLGSWITFMGIFRRTDLEGFREQIGIYQALLPQLESTTETPPEMQSLVQQNARGIHNQLGLYPYTAEECRHWQDQFEAFMRDISRLAARYPVQM